MVAHPLNAIAAALAGENVETHLRPGVDALRDLDGFVLGIIGRCDAVDHVALTLSGKIRMKLNHGASRGHCIRAVDLYLVITLRME